MPESIALYFHIPFCRSKCGYCSFVSFAGREDIIPAYLGALKKEIKRKSRKNPVRSIYFGGGTPSLLTPAQIGEVIATARACFPVAGHAEISLEANPGTVDSSYLKDIRESGVNRLSIGLQSFHNAELSLLGRIHTTDKGTDAFDAARMAGFQNINIDLMYGLPGQNEALWLESLESAIRLGPEHLSLYALTLEDDAPMAQVLKGRGSQPPLPDTAANQYELAVDMLAGAGFVHYEISNWAKPGRECRHNLVYWKNLHYLGLGLTAHSWFDHRRYANTADLESYLNTVWDMPDRAVEIAEEISSELELAETIILGLRLGEGISEEAVNRRFGVDVRSRYRAQIDELVELRLIECADGHIRLTERGQLLGNEVFWRFLP
ncbi:radical SAM family heme chaperone HemW [Chloroflexota bacterium]